MEGLRSPRIGQAYAQPAPQVNPGRAATSIAAAAIIGASGGIAAADAGLSPGAVLTQPLTQTRTAAPASYTGLGGLEGATAMKAPPLGGRAMPSVSNGLASPGGALPPARLSGGAGNLAAALPLALSTGLGILQGKSPLDALKATGQPIPGSPEEAKQYGEGVKRAEANRQAIGDAAKNLLGGIGDAFNKATGRDRQKERQKFKSPKNDTYNPKADNPANNPNSFYQVTATDRHGRSTTFNMYGVVGGIQPIRVDYSWVVAGRIVGDAVDDQNQVQPGSYGKPTVTVTKLSGAGDKPAPDPIPDSNYSPIQAGAPLLGLTPPLANQTSPQLPTMPQTGNKSPSQQQPKLPGTGNPQTKPGERAGDLPSNPSTGEPSKPGGESSPFTPGQPLPSVNSPSPGSTNGSLNSTLPLILGAIPLGSAAIGSPLFPPIFGSQPGTRTNTEIKPIEPASPKPTETPEPGSKCCQMTQDGLAEIKKVLGVGEFPATLPILTGDETRLIKNIPDLLLWNTSNTDAVAGLFPATVKVEQPDSTIKEIKLQNMAHAIEELFAAVLTMAEDCDASVNIGARIATEVVQTKIAVHQGNEMMKAMQRFLGFAVAPVARLIKLNFSPTAAGVNGKLENNEMAGFLKPSQQSYVGVDLHEKQEALPMLQRILQNSEIARLAVWHPLKPSGKTEDNITGTKLKERANKPTKAEKAAWEKKLKDLRARGFEIDDNSPQKGEAK